MRFPRTSVRATWRAKWLGELSIALVVLGIVTREIVFVVVGTGILLVLGTLGLVFHHRLGTLRKELHVTAHLPKRRVLLGDTAELELTVRNDTAVDANILAAQPLAEDSLSFRLSPFLESVRPGTSVGSRVVVVPHARGRFQISGYMLKLGDARHLFTGEFMVSCIDWLEVYPSMRAWMPVTPLALYGGREEVSRRTPMGTNYAGIREYSSGDEYHRIEWKATARLRKLMVKEFHPETQVTLQILIDVGTMMHQQSYVGTRLDEAFAVSWLLADLAVGSGQQVGLWLFNETEIVKAIEPAKAKEQLNKFASLALAPEAQPGEGLAAHATPRTSSSLPALGQLLGKRMTDFLRALNLNLSSGYRKTGMYKALTEARRTALEGFFIILTNPRTMNEDIWTASTPLERNRVILALIGAPWRLSSSLEKAYGEYQKASRAVQHMQQFGLTILDLRPERLIEAIVRHISTSSL